MKNEKSIRWVKPTPKGYDLDYKDLKPLSDKEAENLFSDNNKPKAKSKNISKSK